MIEDDEIHLSRQIITDYLNDSLYVSEESEPNEETSSIRQWVAYDSYNDRYYEWDNTSLSTLQATIPDNSSTEDRAALNSIFVRRSRISFTLESDSRHTQQERVERKKIVRMNTPRKRAKLILPMGFEYTYHGRNPYHTVEKLKKHFVCDEKLGPYFYVDNGMVEMCSPVHKSWKETMDWFLLANTFAKINGLKAWSRKNGGGGMHINITIDHNQNQNLYRNLFAILCLHPEINWVFNEPSDDHTANWLYRDDEVRKYLSDHSLPITISLGGKGYAVNVKNDNHFEIRTFEMPRSIKEHELMVRFANELVKFAKTITEWGVVIDVKSEIAEMVGPDDSEEEDKQSVNFTLSMDDTKLYDDDDVGVGKEQRMRYIEYCWDNAGKMFNNLLRSMGLNPRDYKKFVERNLYIRKNVYDKEHMK